MHLDFKNPRIRETKEKVLGVIVSVEFMLWNGKSRLCTLLHRWVASVRRQMSYSNRPNI